MRNFLAFSFLILSFSLYSGAVSASNVDACDTVFEPSLHGLCVAWHNANPKNQEKIAEKYFFKSGGQEVPGSDPDPEEPPPTQEPAICPCTEEGDIEVWDEFATCADLDVYHDVRRFDLDGYLGTLTVSADYFDGSYSCERDISSTGTNVVNSDLTQAEYDACVLDIVELTDGNFCN